MNRIAVYVYHDKQGEIRDYALYAIKSLMDMSDKMVVVLNGKMKALETEKLQNPKITVIERENKGFDFWGYREAFLSLSNEELAECDELVFTNNSVFGPVFPYSELFGTMKSRNADFWGVTKHPCSNKFVNVFDSSTKIKTHIQTYFIVFRKNMINHPEFRKYFVEMPKVKTKKDAIGLLEVNLTKHFKKLGFEYDTFVDDDILNYGIENSMQYLPDIMLEKYHNPFIKKSAFGVRYDLAQKESMGERSLLALDFIKNNTNYNINLITDEIIRNYSYDNILRFLKLNYTLSDTHRQNFSPDKSAIIYDCSDLHINEIVKPYLKNLYGLVDIYIINRNNIDFDIQGVKMKFLDNSVSYLKQISANASNYDYLYFFVPNEHILSKLNLIQKINYSKHILDCTISSKYFISNVFDTFKKNDFLGALTPVPFVYSGFDISKDIIRNKDLRKFDKLYNYVPDVSLKFLNTILPAFWITSSAFEKVNECVDFDDTGRISLSVAYILLLLKHGKLTGRISTPFIMENYANNLEYRHLSQDKFFADLACKVEKYLN